MAFRDIKEFCRNKDIVIFGTGHIAEKFYNVFADQLNIVYFATSDTMQTEFCGLRKLELNELVLKGNVYIVICCRREVAVQIELQLAMNFKFYEEYIDYKLFVQLYDGMRKLIVSLGRCHQYLVSKALKMTQPIINDYVVMSYWIDQLRITAFRREWNELTRYADVFLVYRFDALEEYGVSRDDARIVIVPEVSATFIWPQISWMVKEPSVYVCNPNVLRKAKICDIRAFRYLDRNVYKMLKEGKSVDETVSIICQKELYSEEQLTRYMERVFCFNREVCGSTCTDICQIIEKNYSKERYFLDGRHWSNSLAWEIVNSFLKQLNIGSIKPDNPNLIEWVALTEDRVWVNEWPIYPCVRETLKLEWVDNSTKYRMVKVDETKEVTFEEYMWEYTNFIYHTMKIQELW